MRKIYQKYFEIPEENNGIIGEHVFFARLTVSIACIALCMAAMGFSAYAFFTAGVTSSMNNIQAANFELNVEAINPLTGTSSAAHEGGKRYTLKPGAYDFVLTKSGNATTGYGQIKMGDQSFYTAQIGVVDANGTQIVTRTVRIAVAQDTIVEIIACWGTYSGNPMREAEEMIIADGNTIELGGMSTVLTTSTTPSTAPSTTTNEATVSSEPTKTSESTTSTETATSIESTTPTESTVANEVTTTEGEETQEETTTESAETQEETTTEETVSSTESQE